MGIVRPMLLQKFLSNFDKLVRSFNTMYACMCACTCMKILYTVSHHSDPQSSVSLFKRFTASLFQTAGNEYSNDSNRSSDEEKLKVFVSTQIESHYQITLKIKPIGLFKSCTASMNSTKFSLSTESSQKVTCFTTNPQNQRFFYLSSVAVSLLLI